MTEKRDIIKIKPKVLLIFGLIAFLIVLVFSLYINKRISKEQIATFSTEIKPSIISYDKPYSGIQRGVIYYDYDLGVSADCELIGNSINNQLWEESPNNSHSLFFLKKPYVISKKENNDTVIVKKDNQILMFLLSKPEN